MRFRPDVSFTCAGLPLHIPFHFNHHFPLHSVTLLSFTRCHAVTYTLNAKPASLLSRGERRHRNDDNIIIRDRKLSAGRVLTILITLSPFSPNTSSHICSCARLGEADFNIHSRDRQIPAVSHSFPNEQSSGRALVPERVFLRVVTRTSVTHRPHRPPLDSINNPLPSSKFSLLLPP